MNRRNGSDIGSWPLPRDRVLNTAVLFVLLAGLITPSETRAQRPGAVNVGLQVGRPGGATLKVYRSNHTVYDGLLTTVGDNFVTLYIHRLHERPLPESLLRVYAGPGVLVGGEALDRRPRMKLGVSGQLGLNFYSDRFEVFLHATPTVRFLPDLRPTVGGSVGLRYMLHQP